MSTYRTRESCYIRRRFNTKKYSAIENSFLLKVEDTHNFMSNFVTPSKRQCVLSIP